MENVYFQDNELDEVLNRTPRNDDEQRESLIRCIIFLACCHTIIIDHKKGRYNSSSPDELALVNAAK